MARRPFSRGEDAAAYDARIAEAMKPEEKLILLQVRCLENLNTGVGGGNLFGVSVYGEFQSGGGGSAFPVPSSVLAFRASSWRAVAFSAGSGGGGRSPGLPAHSMR